MQEPLVSHKSESIPLDELWESYTRYQLRTKNKVSVKKLHAPITERIDRLPTKDLADAPLIHRYIVANEKPRVAKTTFKYISWACDWGVMYSLIPYNPFKELVDKGLGTSFTLTSNTLENKEGLIDFALTNWNVVSAPLSLPARAGIYVIYGGVERTCLYIGQSVNLYKRASEHWAWKEALKEFETARIAYKLIDCSDESAVKKKLTHNECLLIGLLHPLWNSGTPCPGTQVEANSELDDVQQIHWSQINYDRKNQSFRHEMLSDDGYVAMKMIKVKTGNLQTLSRVWVKVLYDKEYAYEWVKDFYNRVPSSELPALLAITRKLFNC